MPREKKFIYNQSIKLNQLFSCNICIDMQYTWAFYVIKCIYIETFLILLKIIKCFCIQPISGKTKHDSIYTPISVIIELKIAKVVWNFTIMRLCELINDTFLICSKSVNLHNNFSISLTLINSARFICIVVLLAAI